MSARTIIVLIAAVGATIGLFPAMALGH